MTLNGWIVKNINIKKDLQLMTSSENFYTCRKQINLIDIYLLMKIKLAFCKLLKRSNLIISQYWCIHYERSNVIRLFIKRKFERLLMQQITFQMRASLTFLTLWYAHVRLNFGGSGFFSVVSLHLTLNSTVKICILIHANRNGNVRDTVLVFLLLILNKLLPNGKASWSISLL